MNQIQEGDLVRTAHGEPAKVYMILPNGEDCVLQMTDQFMPDGGVAFRTVPVVSVKKEAQL